MRSIYIVDLGGDEEPAAFEDEDIAEAFASARGATYIEVLLADRPVGERMVDEARHDD